MNREDNEERKNCERMIEKVMSSVVSRFVPYMNVGVKVKMLGRDDYTISISRQTTLHEYGDIGIESNTDEMYNHLDISINKKVLSNPEIGTVISDLINDIEEKMDFIRLND